MAQRSASRTAPLRVAIDTGGTFTDCVWQEGGRIRMVKVFSTPRDPSRAILGALRRIARLSGVKDPAWRVLHGTTVGTNTLLERKGARIALVTTEGFEDVLEIGRQARPRLYDFFFDRVEPLAPAGRRFGVAERTAPDGSILRAPAPEELRRLAQEVRRARPQAVAVALLFAFANPAHERAVARALAGLRVPLSLSHQILPEFREYERMSTVAVNAYLQPVMQNYLRRLEERVGGGASRARQSVFVMQSSGGITDAASAAREPVRTVLSGPAGGVVGAAATARHSGLQKIIAFDMGGTSTDVCLVEGEPRATSEAEVAGLPVRVPMLDIHTVGAGGGSLARFDGAGALRVGPESAGAEPGPISYGRGRLPTVTDANLLLGRLRPESFLGGEFRLDAARTRRLVAAWLKKQRSGFTPEQFAAGVVRVVNATMEKAIRVVSIERGHDPREFTLVAFGGAGAMHACELAAGLSIPRVLVPALPGALSAFGILVSDVVRDASRTVLLTASAGRLPLPELRAVFGELEEQTGRELRAQGWQGSIALERTVDVRYRGQGYELNVEFTPRLAEEFRAQHQRRYGYSHAGRDLELVTLRLRARIVSPQKGAQAGEAGGRRPAAAKRAASVAQSFVPLSFGGRRLRGALLERAALIAGKSYRGPAIVTEYSATTVVPPGWRFHADRAGNLVVAQEPD